MICAVTSKRRAISLFFLAILVLSLGMLARPAEASLRPGYYDLHGGQGLIVMPANTAENFAQDVMWGGGGFWALATVMAASKAGGIAGMIVGFAWMVPFYRVHVCATRYGAPYVYLYTIWGGLPVWADPAW